MSIYGLKELTAKNQKLADELDRPERFKGEHNIIRMALAKNRRRANALLDEEIIDMKKDKQKKESTRLSVEEKKKKRFGLFRRVTPFVVIRLLTET